MSVMPSSALTPRIRSFQIGSYYGSEIAPVDLDEDGVTDNLLVAAPMFFSAGLEKGKVYIYRVTEQVSTVGSLTHRTPAPTFPVIIPLSGFC